MKRVGYHGQLSCDFRRSRDGALHLLESNPRACNGVCLMPDDVFLDAVLSRELGPTRVIGAGQRRTVALAVLRCAFREPRTAARALRYLVARDTRDVFADPRDLWPAIYQLLTYGQVLRYRRWAGPRRVRRTELIEAYGYDFIYDGQPIPKVSSCQPHRPALRIPRSIRPWLLARRSLFRSTSEDTARSED